MFFLVCYSIRKKLFRYIWENLKKCSSKEYPRKRDKMRQKYSQIVLKTEGFFVYERKIAFGGACGALEQNNNKKQDYRRSISAKTRVRKKNGIFEQILKKNTGSNRQTEQDGGV